MWVCCSDTTIIDRSIDSCAIMTSQFSNMIFEIFAQQSYLCCSVDLDTIYMNAPIIMHKTDGTCYIPMAIAQRNGKTATHSSKARKSRN